jgi:hypothetical protein
MEHKNEKKIETKKKRSRSSMMRNLSFNWQPGVIQSLYGFPGQPSGQAPNGHLRTNQHGPSRPDNLTQKTSQGNFA